MHATKDPDAYVDVPGWDVVYRQFNIATDPETRTAVFDYIGSETPWPEGLPRPQGWEDLGGPDEGYPEYGYLVPESWSP